MKKALLAALSFVLVSLFLVHGSFALPDLGEVFKVVTELLEKGIPEVGGAGTAVHVDLVSDETPQNLFPGGSASRTTFVRNAGTGGIYFRLAYAIQHDAQSWDKLDIDFSAGEGFEMSDWQDITIDNTSYRMKVFTYTSELASGEDSSAVTLAIAMDSSVTSEQIARYREDFLQIQVLAIDPTPFADVADSAEAALNLALPLDNKFNPF